MQLCSSFAIRIVAQTFCLPALNIVEYAQHQKKRLRMSEVNCSSHVHIVFGVAISVLAQSDDAAACLSYRVAFISGGYATNNAEKRLHDDSVAPFERCRIP
jgi:hypothetical protein